MTNTVNVSAGENPQQLLPSTVAAIQSNAAEIADIANVMGVSALAVADPVAREMNKQAEGDYPNSAVQSIKELLVKYSVEPTSDGAVTLTQTTDAELIADHQYVVSSGVSNVASGGVGSLINRVLDPTLNDLGVGKIQLGTAMDTVAYYATMFPDSDPLNLKQYIDHPTALVDRI